MNKKLSIIQLFLFFFGLNTVYIEAGHQASTQEEKKPDETTEASRAKKKNQSQEFSTKTKSLAGAFSLMAIGGIAASISTNGEPSEIDQPVSEIESREPKPPVYIKKNIFSTRKKSSPKRAFKGNSNTSNIGNSYKKNSYNQPFGSGLSPIDEQEEFDSFIIPQDDIKEPPTPSPSPSYKEEKKEYDIDFYNNYTYNNPSSYLHSQNPSVPKDDLPQNGFTQFTQNNEPSVIYEYSTTIKDYVEVLKPQKKEKNNSLDAKNNVPKIDAPLSKQKLHEINMALAQRDLDNKRKYHAPSTEDDESESSDNGTLIYNPSPPPNDQNESEIIVIDNQDLFQGLDVNTTEKDLSNHTSLSLHEELENSTPHQASDSDDTPPIPLPPLNGNKNLQHNEIQTASTQKMHELRNEEIITDVNDVAKNEQIVPKKHSTPPLAPLPQKKPKTQLSISNSSNTPYKGKIQQIITLPKESIPESDEYIEDYDEDVEDDEKKFILENKYTTTHNDDASSLIGTSSLGEKQISFVGTTNDPQQTPPTQRRKKSDSQDVQLNIVNNNVQQSAHHRPSDSIDQEIIALSAQISLQDSTTDNDSDTLSVEQNDNNIPKHPSSVPPLPGNTIKNTLSIGDGGNDQEIGDGHTPLNHAFSVKKNHKNIPKHPSSVPPLPGNTIKNTLSIGDDEIQTITGVEGLPENTGGNSTSSVVLKTLFHNENDENKVVNEVIGISDGDNDEEDIYNLNDDDNDDDDVINDINNITETKSGGEEEEDSSQSMNQDIDNTLFSPYENVQSDFSKKVLMNSLSKANSLNFNKNALSKNNNGAYTAPSSPINTTFKPNIGKVSKTPPAVLPKDYIPNSSIFSTPFEMLSQKSKTESFDKIVIDPNSPLYQGNNIQKKPIKQQKINDNKEKINDNEDNDNNVQSSNNEEDKKDVSQPPLDINDNPLNDEKDSQDSGHDSQDSMDEDDDDDIGNTTDQNQNENLIMDDNDEDDQDQNNDLNKSKSNSSSVFDILSPLPLTKSLGDEDYSEDNKEKNNDNNVQNSNTAPPMDSDDENDPQNQDSTINEDDPKNAFQPPLDINDNPLNNENNNQNSGHNSPQKDNEQIDISTPTMSPARSFVKIGPDSPSQKEKDNIQTEDPIEHQKPVKQQENKDNEEKNNDNDENDNNVQSSNNEDDPINASQPSLEINDNPLNEDNNNQGSGQDSMDKDDIGNTTDQNQNENLIMDDNDEEEDDQDQDNEDNNLIHTTLPASPKDNDLNKLKSNSSSYQILFDPTKSVEASTSSQKPVKQQEIENNKEKNNDNDENDNNVQISNNEDDPINASQPSLEINDNPLNEDNNNQGSGQDSMDKDDIGNTTDQNQNENLIMDGDENDQDNNKDNEEKNNDNEDNDNNVEDTLPT